LHIINTVPVLTVWEKLKNQKHGERWQPEQEEEYEDSQGNVVNRKTYEDLKRQGLL
jgi:splicing factor 3A subunit 3